MSVISQDNTYNIQKIQYLQHTEKVYELYYTHKGRHEGLYTKNDNYDDVTPSSSSTSI
jgi:hypothetical protein